MKRRWTSRFWIVAGAVSLLPVTGQELPEFRLRSESRLVLLDVSVKDHKGVAVAGLSKDNFKIIEDGREQPIEVFAEADVPVTVGLIIDESYSMSPKRASVITAAQTFIKESNPRDEMFVINFNDAVSRGLPDDVTFSDDRKQLSSAMYRGRPEGKTALYDAVIEGLKQLEQGTRDKKTLIVVSDGGDNASQHTRKEMLDMVAKSAATVYTIGLFDINDPDRNPGILRQLAGMSGGEAYFPDSPPETIPICEKIAREIRTRYTLGFIPKPGAAGLRHVHVRVAAEGHSGLTAHTRKSYEYDAIPG